MSPTVYLILSLVVLAIVASLVYFISRKRSGIGKPLSPLAGLAFAFILAGLFFGGNQWVGYGLMGIGVVLAVIDIIMKIRAK
jgi:drug/metabolite transporter (DMT)-like permease